MAIVIICCKNCKQDFTVKYKDRDRLFCGKSCAGIFTMTGKKKSQETIDKIKLTKSKCLIDRNCLNCNVGFKTSKSRNCKYCSRDCFRLDSNKQYGFRKDSLLNIWIRKYGVEEAQKLQLLKNDLLSLKHKENISKMTLEEKQKRFSFPKERNPMIGKSMRFLLIQKYGEIEGVKIFDESIKKGFETKKLNGTNKCSDSKRITLRLSKINNIERNIKDKLSPRYNPKACVFIDDFAKRNNYNFIHAENGGEFYLNDVGCYLDGYDIENNIVLEF
mgnify:FL=1